MTDISEWNLNDALRQYKNNPSAINTPDADSNLLDCEHDTSTLTVSLINAVLNTVLDSVLVNIENIYTPYNLDSLQFLLKHATSLPGASFGRLLDLIVSAITTETENTHNDIEADDNDTFAAHKVNLELLAYLLQWLLCTVDARTADKPLASTAKSRPVKSSKQKSADAEWDSLAPITTALDAVAKLLKIKLSKLFVTTSDRDTFISLVTRPVYVLLENEIRVKNVSFRMHAYKLLCIAIKQHGHASAAHTNIDQCLSYFDHLSEPIAELLNILADQYDHSQLAEDVLRELSNKQFAPNDLKGPKSISAFITKLSELAPAIVIKQVTLLAKLLDSDSYTLRCSIIEVCGNMIVMLTNQQDPDGRENTKSQINVFFHVLEERFLDVNPYCRCRAIQVYTRICDLETKYPKRRQVAAELAVRSLHDKSSNVRRNATKLIGRLLSTHPFAVLHGGQLSLAEWTQRMQDCEAQIAQLVPANSDSRPDATVDAALLDDATQTSPVKEHAVSEEDHRAQFEKATKDAADAELVGKLQLTRRYYVEAIKFINVVEEASTIALQLLSSKNKSEVIEVMDFFVIADAYQISNARDGIRQMLRLIWTKGNSDEGKGVQTHLIECYKGLFFDAPDHLSPNDAANYVARNMISLTFGATSAGLTSLEQLLGTMTKADLISPAVVQKLWQVYGVTKDISRNQRRGAIIVLGMLALADSDIVAKEIETCLQIGLGSYGQKDLSLARFTCIALMRMNGVKQTKGAESSPLARLDNNHAVLQRLAAMTLVKSTSTDWYGMAEQAIGAIYTLSKHPDVLCTEIVRLKTRHVFAPPSSPAMSHDPEAMDIDEPEQTTPATAPEQINVTSSLSQLLFVVGHVAIKQIVHLELCEQDFKRRKAEKEKEMPKDSSPSKKRQSKAADKTALKAEEEDEMDLIAGTNEDDFTDAIQHVRERELLFGQQSLLSSFGPLVREICSNNTSYINKDLQAQAALCMAKLMCVSSAYCQDNLALLITILERSEDSTARSNLVVALADMAVCFNHLIDENTDYLYRRLADPSLSVKRTCLLTLTFLILAGQVKVKGQLGEMAKCVEDEDERIRDMSRMFFGELAGKDNAIYNNFVDMFSLLSMDEQLDQDQFKKILRFLSTFIEKDKHAKQLASKLAARLPRVESERQWDDVTFVLGLLQHKDDEITRMIGEGYKTVQAAA